jgi:hypothetical protein
MAFQMSVLTFNKPLAGAKKRMQQLFDPNREARELRKPLRFKEALKKIVLNWPWRLGRKSPYFICLFKLLPQAPANRFERSLLPP